MALCWETKQMIGQKVTVMQCQNCKACYIKLGYHEGEHRYILGESRVEFDGQDGYESLFILAEYVEGLRFNGREVKLPLIHECKS
jgi:hypothetical protein